MYIMVLERSRLRGGRCAWDTPGLLRYGRIPISVELLLVELTYLYIIEIPWERALPHPPQTPAASFKRLYRTRAEHSAYVHGSGGTRLQ